jgi:hypothetical protein
MYDDSIAIVRLLSAYGIVDSQKSDEHYLKWLSCWTHSLVVHCGRAIKELGKFDFSGLYDEIAGICRYSIALDLLLNKDQLSKLYLDRHDSENYYLRQKMALQEALLRGLEFSEQVERFYREYPKLGTVKDLRTESNGLLCGHHKVLTSLAGNFNFYNVHLILKEQCL